MRRHPVPLALLAVLLALALSACALLQASTPPTPQNPTQGVILAGYEVAAAVNAAAASYDQGLIDAEALRTVTNAAEEAQVALGTARLALELGDVDTAAGQLEMTRTLLATMRSLLGGER